VSAMYNTVTMLHWKPSDYYEMGPGERMITRVFMRQYIEDINHAMKKER